MEAELQNVRNIILKSMNPFKLDEACDHSKLLESKNTPNNGLRRRSNPYCFQYT
jgi:hypothetical protein